MLKLNCCMNSQSFGLDQQILNLNYDSRRLSHSYQSMCVAVENLIEI